MAVSAGGVVLITILTLLALTGIAGAVFIAMTNRAILTGGVQGHIGIKYNTLKHPEATSTFAALQQVVESLQVLACNQVFRYEEFMQMKHEIIVNLAASGTLPPSCEDVKTAAQKSLEQYKGTEYEDLAKALAEVWAAAAKNVCKDDKVDIGRLDEFMTSMYKSICR